MLQPETPRLFCKEGISLLLKAPEVARMLSLGRTKVYEMMSAGHLPVRRFHDLRHTTASLLLHQNIHPRVVMDQLGHSEIRLTMDTYSHVGPVLQREAAEAMNTFLKPSKPARK